MSEVRTLGDMGEGTKLSLFKQDDGDIIVSVIPPGKRFAEHSVEFCTSGGKHPEVWQALFRLWQAMKAESAPGGE